MELFAYTFGLSLGPTLVGFFLGLGFVKYVYKTTLIKQAKWIAYLSAVLISAVVISIFYPISSSTNVVIGTTVGFVLTLLVGRILRKSKKDDEIEI
jgi:xanthine/uracil permease